HLACHVVLHCVSRPCLHERLAGCPCAKVHTSQQIAILHEIETRGVSIRLRLATIRLGLRIAHPPDSRRRLSIHTRHRQPQRRQREQDEQSFHACHPYEARKNPAAATCITISLPSGVTAKS